MCVKIIQLVSLSHKWTKIPLLNTVCWFTELKGITDYKAGNLSASAQCRCSYELYSCPVCFECINFSSKSYRQLLAQSLHNYANNY